MIRAGVGGRRPVRRLERALLLRPLDARRRRRCSTGTPIDVDWYTTREREQTEVLPWDHLDSGLDKDWLWEDWQDALDEVEVEDCRWTPCFDCGVCPQMGTDIQIGPTGQTLLPLTVLGATRDRSSTRLRSEPPDGPQSRGTAATAGRPEAPGPLRQARPAAVHQPPRHRARLRAGAAASRTCRWPTRPASRPHPKVSYAGAAPTGTASEAEYLEISRDRAAATRTPSGRRWTTSLPAGLDVLEVVEAAAGHQPGRAARGRVWRIELPGVGGRTEARAAVDSFLAAPEVSVQRMMKNGLRTFDARAAVHTLDLEPSATPAPAGPGESPDGNCAILRAVVRHSTPAVRPDDVLTALRVVADLVPPSAPRVTRLAQGPLDSATGAVSDPLEPDRRRSDQEQAGH